jgi:hypothetical protein
MSDPLSVRSPHCAVTDIESKEQALAQTAPPGITPGRYKPPDPLLAFLESL